jgi:hypothetical protein
MDFYPSKTNIDLREEMDAILYGRMDMIPQGRKVILRELTDTFCECWDGLEGGPIQDCKYCQGEGYKFRERMVTMAIYRGVAPVYKPGYLGKGVYPQNEWGYDDPNRATCYCDYRTFKNYERYTLTEHKYFDKLYEVKLKEDGSVYYPITRSLKWKILNVVPIHGDYGRIEYFELALSKENIG